jgi:hypothetical protein
MNNFSQEGKWKKAQKENTVESYRNFLQKYPTSEYSDDAQLQVIELEYDMVQKTNTIESYRSFIKKYPEANLISDAKDKLILLEYREVEKDNTLQSYKYFIDKYPDGILTEKAKKNLISLEFLQAEQQNTIRTYEDFIKKYPESDFADKAKSYLERLEYMKVESENSIQAYNNFLEKYPNSENRFLIDNKIRNIKLGCDFTDNPLSAEAEEELSNTLDLMGKGRDVELLSKLYDCLVEYPEIKKNAKTQIHKVLISAINSDNDEQFIINNEKVNKLLDYYTFIDSYFPEYSYEAALCRELQVKVIRPFLKNILNDLYQKSIDAGVAMLRGNSDGKNVMMQCIALQREMEPMARAVDSRTASDLVENEMTKCAKYQYLSIIDKILSGEYEKTYTWNLGSKSAFNYEEKLKQKELEQENHEDELIKKLKKFLSNEKDKIVVDYTIDIISRYEN